MLIAYRSDVLLFKALDHDVVRFYGQISYSFYLLHPLSIWWINRLTLLLHEQVETMPVSLLMTLMYIFSLIAITPLAWLCWRFVELPAMNWLRSPPAPRYGPQIAASGDGRGS